MPRQFGAEERIVFARDLVERTVYGLPPCATSCQKACTQPAFPEKWRHFFPLEMASLSPAGLDGDMRPNATGGLGTVGVITTSYPGMTRVNCLPIFYSVVAFVWYHDSCIMFPTHYSHSVIGGKH